MKPTEEGDYIDRYRYDLKTTNKKKETKAAMYVVLFFLFMVALAMLCSCKKKNKQMQPIPVVTPIPQENLWLLGGDWKCIGGDTMFTQILHISYCCEANNGTMAVYYINYPIWCRITNITASYFYNTDTLRLDNCSVTNNKQVYFAKIK